LEEDTMMLEKDDDDVGGVADIVACGSFFSFSSSNHKQHPEMMS